MARAAPRRFLRRRSTLAIVLLGFAFAGVMQALGWAQTSYMTLVKSVAHEGTPQVDTYHWESRDTAFTNGHFFSVKAPGLPALVLPLYMALDATGGDRLAERIAQRARRTGDSRWHFKQLPIHNYGFKASIRDKVQRDLENQSPLVWMLGLLGSVLPAVALLFLVRWAGDRLEPGYGAPAAVTLGAATMVLPFATQLMGHILAAMLAFAGFALLMRERAGPPRVALVALAGLLSGLAVTTEYPLAFVGVVVGVYAISRGDVVRRGAAFSAGAIAGVLPLLAYNQWAFGSPGHLSYENAVAVGGHTGHATLGLNGSGFFGITMPDPWTALELLFSARGLLTTTPVLAAAAYGLFVAARRGHRAEALTAGAITVVFLVWNSGYWTPFGGGTPGPRFLMPILPFLALGLASAWRARPALTAMLALPSALHMLAATLTRPLIGDAHGAGEWIDLMKDGDFVNTVLITVGVTGWVAVAPLVALVVLALWLGRPRLRHAAWLDVRLGAAAITLWAAAAATTPALFHTRAAYRGDTQAALIIALGAGVALALGLAVARASRHLPDPRSGGEEHVADERPVELAAHT